MRRKRIFGGLLLTLSLAMVCGGGNGVARAQTTDDGTSTDSSSPSSSAAALGGFEGTAASSGIYAFYNAEGALPVGPLVGVGLPDALATISSGPSTFARAAAADPGDILANPDAVLALASGDYPAGTIPAYPYRASATSGLGAPSSEASPGPGLSARAEATEEGSSARATLPRTDAPAVATFGSVVASSETSTKDDKITVHVRTSMSDVKVLKVLTIDSVVTDLTAVTDGGEVKTSGATTVSGASFMGQPVTIGPAGVQPANVNDLLEQAGITITVAGPVQQGAETAGQLASTGLRIQFDFNAQTVPLLNPLLDAVPSPPGLAPGAPTLDDAVVAARAHHLAYVEIARGLVKLSASGAGSDEALGEDLGLPTDASLSGVDASLGTLDGVGSGGTGGGTTRGLTPALASRVPKVPLGAGIGALVLLMFLVQPLLGGRLAKLAGAVLAADDAEACPWEER
jgi:hypothetical protein